MDNKPLHDYACLRMSREVTGSSGTNAEVYIYITAAYCGEFAKIGKCSHHCYRSRTKLIFLKEGYLLNVENKSHTLPHYQHFDYTHCTYYYGDTPVYKQYYYILCDCYRQMQYLL